MATVRPGVLKKGEYNEERANKVVVEKLPVDIADADLKTRVVEVVKEAKELVDLTGAEVVVSVGPRHLQGRREGHRAGQGAGSRVQRRRSGRLPCSHSTLAG